MKLFKNKKLIYLLLLPIIGLFVFEVIQSKKVTTVRAFGHLDVDFGVPEPDPIFVVNNMLPGDCETRPIIVTNTDDEMASNLAIRSDNEVDNDNLSSVMNVKITENATELYSDTLQNFFIASDGIDGVALSLLSPSETKTYQMEVCFDSSAENEFQNTSVIFDLIVGEVISEFGLPAECSELEGIITQVVEGTEGDDDIRATNANELILGFGGDDKLDGNNGDDCIVGGDGNDEIDGGDENDIIVGGLGDDDIDGGSDNDIIWGGEGIDDIKGGSEDDLIYGQDGNDVIDGQSGSDTIYGGSGNDDLDGGSGNDFIFGESGDDELDGSSGVDYLDGGPGVDFLRGGTNSPDQCINGETNHFSCEIVA